MIKVAQALKLVVSSADYSHIDRLHDRIVAADVCGYDPANRTTYRRASP